MDNPVLNAEVTAFLDAQAHPLRELIESLRRVILSGDRVWLKISNGMDRITVLLVKTASP